jgi:hypothetical protein
MRTRTASHVAAWIAATQIASICTRVCSPELDPASAQIGGS